MAIDMVSRSFARLPRNSAMGADQSESIPLTPTSRNVGIESAEGSEYRESSTGWTHDGRTHVRVRNKLSPAEEPHWKKAEIDRCLGTSRRGGLEDFPKFFGKYEEAGLEMKQGLFNIWSTFLIAESVLVSIAIQPFVTNIPNLSGWKLKLYGGFWMVVILIDVTSFLVTAICLGYLHAYPGKLTYMWLCHIGQWAGIPSVLVVIGAIATLGAIACTSWIIYGSELGIICAGIEVLILMFCSYTAICLAKAGKAMEALQ